LGRDYDVTRDGQQFVTIEPESEEYRNQQVNIVLTETA